MFSTGIIRLSGLEYTNVPVQVFLIHLGAVIVGGWNAPGNGAENVVIASHIFLCGIIIAYHWPNFGYSYPYCNSLPLTATIRVNQHENKNNIHCAFPSTREHEI